MDGSIFTFAQRLKRSTQSSNSRLPDRWPVAIPSQRTAFAHRKGEGHRQAGHHQGDERERQACGLS